jgi:hypothetical protein
MQIGAYRVKSFFLKYSRSYIMEAGNAMRKT